MLKEYGHRPVNIAEVSTLHKELPNVALIDTLIGCLSRGAKVYAWAGDYFLHI